MQSPSKLKASSLPLFLDASVVINLLAADCLGALSLALERPIVIEQAVLGEVAYHPKTKTPTGDYFSELARNGAIKIVTCSESELVEFLRLVSAAEPDDLDDGEAATLACAHRSGHAAIDERKGRRVAARDYPALSIFHTVDLIFSPQFCAFFGEQRTVEIARAARAIGRMHVPHEWLNFMKKTCGAVETAPH